MSSLESRLLAICNVADALSGAGRVDEDLPCFDQCFFVDEPTAYVGGDLGINALLIGDVEEGKVYCFRGTLSFLTKSIPESQKILDWVQDFHAEQVQWMGLPGLVHRGFTSALDTIAGPLAEDSGPMRIYCGHSKGGAMAKLAAMLYFRQVGRPVQCVTFGAPRVGNADFVKAFNESGVSLTRHEFAGDIVPHVPMNVAIAEKLGRLMGIKFPIGIYESPDQMAYASGSRAVWKPDNAYARLGAESEALLAIGAKFAKDGFEGIVKSHSISSGGGYWRAVNQQ